VEPLPRWDLTELYTGPEDPRFLRDLRTAGGTDATGFPEAAGARNRLETYIYLSQALGAGSFPQGKLPFLSVLPGGESGGGRDFPAETGSSLSDPAAASRADALLSSLDLPLLWGKNLFSPRPEVRRETCRKAAPVLASASEAAGALYLRQLTHTNTLLSRKGMADPLELAAAETGLSISLLNRLLERLEALPLPEWYLRGGGSSGGGSGPAPVSFEEAARILRERAGVWHPDLEKAAGRIFDGGWIDAEPREGKRRGAFTHSGTGAGHPFVFLNYTGTVSDAAALGHEVFHGIHYLLRPAGTPEPRAVEMEAVSVLGEFLVLSGLEEGRRAGPSLSGRSGEEAEPERRGFPGFPGGLRQQLLLKTLRQGALFQAERQFLSAFRRRSGRIGSRELETVWLETAGRFCPGAPPVPRDWGPFWMTVGHFFHFPLYGLNYVLGGILALVFLDEHRLSPGGTGERLLRFMAGEEGTTPAERFRRSLGAGTAEELAERGAGLLAEALQIPGTERQAPADQSALSGRTD